MKDKLKILDLCSGIGGVSLGLESTGKFETVAFVEIDSFCQRVLKKHWPDTPIFDDLKELAYESNGTIPEHDLICGGIPCQPFSVAGKQKGKEDDRHLWPFMFEIIKRKKPTFAIVENVGGFVNVALDDVCLDLETEGYATQSFIIPACGVEAPHRRDRIWIIGKQDVADPESLQSYGGEDGDLKEKGEGQGQFRGEDSLRFPGRSNWRVEPSVGRVAHGVPNRVDRLKSLGNSIVPQIAYNIGLAIIDQYVKDNKNASTSN